MKICFITPSTGTIQGGGETTVRQFAKYLSKNNEVTILTGRSRYKPIQREMLDAPYKVLTVPFWPRQKPLNRAVSKLVRHLWPFKTESLSFYYNVLLRPKIRQKIKDMDVISTHYWLDSKLFSNLAFKLGVPSVFHILGGPYSKKFFETDRSTLYVATNLFTQRLINDAHNFNIEHVVTPGIPSWALSHQHKEKHNLQKKLLFVGRLEQPKGVFELVDIFAKLLESNENLSLIIVGDGSVMEKLKDAVIKRDLQRKIIFKGSVPYQKVFDYYFYSELFLFPSKSETFGMVPLEAMACGLPVIASDIPGLRDSTGGNAILLPPDDVDNWVKNIEMVLTDEKLRKDLSIKGREWARQFIWEKKAGDYGRCLEEAVKKFERINI